MESRPHDEAQQLLTRVAAGPPRTVRNMGATKTMAMLNDMPQFVDALAFAAYKHRDHRRKSAAASPYINHPIALAHVLVSEGGKKFPNSAKLICQTRNLRLIKII